ncbi:MAG: hypothetical protein ACTSWC_07515 [Promethearchaeota archaeon]
MMEKKNLVIILFPLIFFLSFSAICVAQDSQQNVYEVDISGDASNELQGSTLSLFQNLNVTFYSNGLILNNDYNNIFQKIQLVPTTSQSISDMMEIILTNGHGEISYISLGKVNISNYLYWNLSNFNGYIEFSSYRQQQFANNSIIIKYDPIHLKYYEYHARENNLVEEVIVNCKTNLTESVRIKIINTEFNSKYLNSWNFEEAYLGIRLIQSYDIPSNHQNENFTKVLIPTLITGSVIGWIIIFTQFTKKKRLFD